MADRQIGVGMQATYKSDLGEKLRKDKRTLEAFQRLINRTPLVIPVKLDIDGARKQAAQIRDAVLGEVSKRPASGIVGADGRAIASEAKKLNEAAGLLSRTEIFAGNDSLPKTVRDVEQLGDGLQRIREFRRDDESGELKLATVTEKDIRTVKQLEDGLRNLNKEQGQLIAAAKGRGDKEGQLAGLRSQAASVEALLGKAAEGGLLGSAGFVKAENKLDSIRQKIAGLEGGKVSAAEKAARDELTRERANEFNAEERRVQSELKANKLAMERAEQIKDVVAREAEVNRLYEERKRLFAESRDKFREADKALQEAGRPDLADRANRRTLGMQNSLNQAELDQVRRQTDVLREQEKANASLEAQRNKALDQARRLDESEQEKARKQEEASRRNALGESLRRELQDEQTALAKRIEMAKANERLAKAEAKTAEERAAAAQRGAEQRSRIRGQAAGAFEDIERRANDAGFGDVGLQARGARGRAEVANIREMDRAEKAAKKLEDANRKSGHALDFHSNSLARNAATFASWYAPAQAVLGVINAFNAGIRDAIRINRQFATLQAVFRGTAAEAQRLKQDTLELAVANGRSSEEALDSAVRWSRLGLTRVQVNRAVETSLIAANVAEIKASEAAEKLAAIYATYSLSVEDLPVVLNRLNAISNRYNVTNKDLLEGIVRVAGVAKQAGLELRDLEGIIGAVTGATGRPGQEVGNALKFVITRITDPSTVKKLKDQFDVDLTQPNGDLKDFADILAQLAAEFPKLNTAEKQQFLALTAGSRQAARFALILDQYRQSQILAAEAAFDSASAYKENEKIIASLASRLEGLRSSWTELFTAVGDAGVFDAISAILQEVTLGVRTLTDVVDGAGGTLGDFIGKLADIAQGDPTGSFELSNKVGGVDLGVIENFLARASGLGLKIGKGLGGGGFDNLLGDLNPEELKEAARSLRESGFDAAADSIEKKISKTAAESGKSITRGLVAPVNELRERLTGLERSSQVFTGIADDIDAGGKSREAIIRDFENAAHLLLNLEDGQQRYAQALSDFNAAAASGDMAKIAAMAREMADAFGDAVPEAAKAFTEKQATALAGLREQMKGLNVERKALLAQPVPEDPEGAKKRSDSMQELTDRIKTLQAEIDSLTKAAEQFEALAFSTEATDRIGDYLDAVKELSKAVGEFAAKGRESDPVDRIFARRRRAIGLPVEFLGQELEATEKEAERRRARAGFLRGIGRAGVAGGLVSEDDGKKLEAALDRQLRQQDAAVQTIKTRVNLAQEEVDKKLLLIDAEEKLAQLGREQEESARRAGDSAAAALVGRNETEKLLSQTEFVLSRSQRSLLEAPAGMDPAGRNRLAGAVLQDETTARENLLELEKRAFEIVAERSNLEIAALDDKIQREFDFQDAKRRMEEDADIAARRDDEDAAVARGRREEGFLLQRKRLEEGILETARKQNEEASKRLQMASREDQLRAAALSRTVRDKGAIGANEFFALSQSTRQAIVNYLPDQAPGDLSPRREEERRQREAQAKNERRQREDDAVSERNRIEDRSRGRGRRREDADLDFNRGEEDAGRALGRARAELERESGLIAGSLETLRIALSDVSARITAETGKGGKLDVVPGSPGVPVQNVADTRDKQPPVNVNVGAVQVEVRVTEDMEAIFRQIIDPKFADIEARIAAMARGRARPPTPQGAVE